MNAAFLNEVMLESLTQDDLKAFELDYGTDMDAAEAYDWQSSESAAYANGLYESSLFDDGEFEAREAMSPYFDNEWGDDPYGSTGLTEAEVHELASSLMSLETPMEAEEFLGKLFKKATGKLAKFARPLVAKVAPLVGAGLGSMVPGVGTALGGMAGKALGSLVGGGGGNLPGIPSNISSALGQFIGKGGNPLAGILQSGIGKGLLGKLMGGELEMASDAEAQFELAKRTVRALDGMAQQMSDIDESQHEFEQLASDAMLRAVREHLPAGIRPALIDTRRG